MDCGSVQINCCRRLRAEIPGLFVEIQRGDVVIAAYAREHGAVRDPFGRIVSHTQDFNPFAKRPIRH
jgi:hypothetical protein